MYPEKVKSLDLEEEKLRIKFKDIDNNDIPAETLVEEVFLPLKSELPFSPDYAARGFYQKVNDNQENIFLLEPGGPHLLFITGIPLQNKMHYNLKDRFRLANPILVTYWQDTQNGYLAQIVNV